MQRQKWTPGQCIFCAFRSQTWPPRRQPRARAADFSTSASLPAYRRLEIVRPPSRFTELDSPRNPRSVVRPTFLDRGERRRDATKRDLLSDIPDPLQKKVARRQGQISLKGQGRLTLSGMKSLIYEQLDTLHDEMRDSELRQTLQIDDSAFKKLYGNFRSEIYEAITDQIFALREDKEQPLFAVLMDIFTKKGADALSAHLRHMCYGHLVGSKFTKTDIQNQKALADLRYPTEWFPKARTIQREIHLHVGPTNSGKTYHALKRLEEAYSGVYAGPLRLLAHEVYTRLNAKGKRCALITGEERRYPDEESIHPLMSSCTVEMVPLNEDLDVAVIDEIQMIGAPDRGWAWTQALLGLQAKEVHICGEERTVPLIKELAAMMGDKLEIHKYKRLSPLEMMPKSLNGKLKNLQKGDCVVVFSVMGIHAMRKEIEKATGRKVAIVYGSLPPETRAQQARLFNDPNNDYDFLVASDAIGMGLNLSIKRVIFESAQKSNGYQMVTLKTSDIKQIAGRAGRYRTAAQATEPTQAPPVVDINDGASSLREPAMVAANPPAPVPAEAPTPPPDKQNVGYVTTLEDFDYPIVARAMLSEADPIRTAGIIPPAFMIERFSSYFPPGTPFSYILLRLSEISQTSGRFHMCGLSDQLTIADTIQPVKGLTTVDRIIFCAAPASRRDKSMQTLLRALADCVARQGGGNLLDIAEFNLEVLDQKPDPSRQYLNDLETLHKGLVLYLWLSYRFSGIFTTRALCFHVKELVEKKIEECLRNFAFTPEMSKAIRAKKQERFMKNLQKSIGISIDDGSVNEAYGKGHVSWKPAAVTEFLTELGDGVEGSATAGGAEQDEGLAGELGRMLDAKQFDIADDEAELDDLDEYPSPELEELDEGEPAIEADAAEGAVTDTDVSDKEAATLRRLGDDSQVKEQRNKKAVDDESTATSEGDMSADAMPMPVDPIQETNGQSASPQPPASSLQSDDIDPPDMTTQHPRDPERFDSLTADAPPEAENQTQNQLLGHDRQRADPDRHPRLPLPDVTRNGSKGSGESYAQYHI